MPKLDLKKELKHLYNPSAKEPVVVDVPTMSFLMVDGEGDPNSSQAFEDAVEALYAVSYTVKFAVKKSRGLDYTVAPLEGLWWMDAMSEFSLDAKGRWKWMLMIMQPDAVTKADVEAAMKGVAAKKNPPALSKMRFEAYTEGLSAQIMHVGPYEEEKPTIVKLIRFAADAGYKPAGKHHEIYLNDPGRTSSERLKTVIRLPVRK
jgi:hypothetical protein